MKYIPLFLAITLGLAHGKSNSSGPDSPVLFGKIIAVSTQEYQRNKFHFYFTKCRSLQ